MYVHTVQCKVQRYWCLTDEEPDKSETQNIFCFAPSLSYFFKALIGNFSSSSSSIRSVLSDFIWWFKFYCSTNLDRSALIRLITAVMIYITCVPRLFRFQLQVICMSHCCWSHTCDHTAQDTVIRIV